MTAVVPHLRTSERKTLKRCPQRWQWEWRQGLRTRAVKPDALWFGIGVHLALQERYRYPGLRRGKNVLKVWREYVGDEIAYVRTIQDADPGVIAPEPDWIEAKELGEAMLGGYLDHYGKDERWHIISAEQTFEIPIPRPKKAKPVIELIDGEWQIVAPSPEPLTFYNGTFDLVALDLHADEESSLWLWDHKTAQSIDTQHLALDDQGGSYWAFAGDVLAHQGLIQPGMKLEGIYYNYLRKSLPDTRPVNEDGYATNKPVKADYGVALLKAGLSVVGTLATLQERAEAAGIPVYGEVSKIQPARRFERVPFERTAAERRIQIGRIQDEALYAESLRNKSLPIIKNTTTDCHWQCPFFAMCELHEGGGDWKSFRDAVYTRRDPYADHRKAAI